MTIGITEKYAARIVELTNQNELLRGIVEDVRSLPVRGEDYVSGIQFIRKNELDPIINRTTKSNRVVELEEALRERLEHGHNDTCAHMLTSEYECNCGQDKARQLLAKEDK